MIASIEKISMRALSLTALALIAFATNSVLYRLALGEKNFVTVSFTFDHLRSGALILFAAVQATIIFITLIKDNRPYISE